MQEEVIQVIPKDIKTWSRNINRTRHNHGKKKKKEVDNHN